MLNFIFGKDTKSVRTFNFITSFGWLVIIVFALYKPNTVALPHIMLENYVSQLIFASLTCLFCLLSFTAVDYRRRLFKVMCLLLGSLFQSITAVYYVTIYPPLDLMLLVCSGFALWFFLAVLYIIRYEGLRDVK